MNEYRVLVERYWLGKTEVLGQKPVWTPLFTTNKTWPFRGINPGPQAERPASNHLGHGTAYRLMFGSESWLGPDTSHIYQVLPWPDINKDDSMLKISLTQPKTFNMSPVSSTCPPCTQDTYMEQAFCWSPWLQKQNVAKRHNTTQYESKYIVLQSAT